MKNFIFFISAFFLCPFVYSQNSINYNITVENGAQLTNWTTSLYQTFYPGEKLKIYASGQVDIKPEIREETKSQLFGLIKKTIRYTVNNLHYSCQQPQHIPHSYTFTSNKNNFIFSGVGNCNNPSNTLLEYLSIPYNNDPFEEFNLKTKLLNDPDLSSPTLPSSGQYIFNIQIDFSRRLTFIDNYIQELSTKGNLNKGIVELLKKDRKLVDSHPIEITDILKKIIRNGMSDTKPDKKAILEFCLELNPLDIDLMAVAGKCFFAQGDFEKAEMTLQIAIKEYIQNPNLLKDKPIEQIRSMADALSSMDKILTNSGADYINNSDKLNYASYCLKLAAQLYEKLDEVNLQLETYTKLSQNVKLFGSSEDQLEAITLIEKITPLNKPFDYLKVLGKNKAEILLIKSVLKNKWYILDTLQYNFSLESHISDIGSEMVTKSNIYSKKYQSSNKPYDIEVGNNGSKIYFTNNMDRASLNLNVAYNIMNKKEVTVISEMLNPNFLKFILKNCSSRFEQRNAKQDSLTCFCNFTNKFANNFGFILYFNLDKNYNIVSIERFFNRRIPVFFDIYNNETYLKQIFDYFLIENSYRWDTKGSGFHLILKPPPFHSTHYLLNYKEQKHGINYPQKIISGSLKNKTGFLIEKPFTIIQQIK